MIVGAGSFAGLWASATSSSVLSVYLFYGCLFGFANGLGYGYTLQLAGQVTAKRHAVSMSLVTAFYAVGAAGASQFFYRQIARSDLESTLKLGAGVIAVVCLIAALTTLLTRHTLALEKAAHQQHLQNNKRLQIMLWLLYGSSVTAGLMVIGHALPIYIAKHPQVINAALSPVMVSIGNIVGGLCIGLATLKFSNRKLLLTFSVCSLCGLLLMWQQWFTDIGLTLTGLLLIGFSYGAIIAIFPIVVTDTFGKLSAPRIYGQIFTAWGLAGLFAPTLSGYIFDRTGSYRLSIALALIVCVIALGVLSRLQFNNHATHQKNRQSL